MQAVDDIRVRCKVRGTTTSHDDAGWVAQSRRRKIRCTHLQQYATWPFGAALLTSKKAIARLRCDIGRCHCYSCIEETWNDSGHTCRSSRRPMSRLNFAFRFCGRRSSRPVLSRSRLKILHGSQVTRSHTSQFSSHSTEPALRSSEAKFPLNASVGGPRFWRNSMAYLSWHAHNPLCRSLVVALRNNKSTYLFLCHLCRRLLLVHHESLEGRATKDAFILRRSCQSARR